MFPFMLFLLCFLPYSLNLGSNIGSATPLMPVFGIPIVGRSYIFLSNAEKSCDPFLLPHCDHMKAPISIDLNPCIAMKGSKGYLHLYYIPRRDIKKLYFNLYISFNSMHLPMRKEVICRGSDDVYSFCRALKGETVNTRIPFSFRGIRFSKGRYKCVAEAISGDTEEMLFCLNFTIIHHPDFN